MPKKGYVIDEKAVIEELVMQLNPKAFDYCKEELFDIFGYRYIEKKDFRIVDLMEQFMFMVNECAEDIKRNQGVLKFYAQLLEQKFGDYVSTKEDSRADKFQNKALSLLAEFKIDKGRIDDIYDANMVFISLFRENYQGEKVDKDLLDDADFSLRLDDFELLKAIFNGIKPNGRKLKLAAQMAYKSSQELRDKFFYMFSVVILVLGLQLRGIV